jgi:PAS domain S-box-containing protein
MGLRLLLVLLVLLAVGPLLGIEFASSQREQDGRMRQARESVEALADHMADSQLQRVEGTRQLLAALALSPAVSGDDREACSAYMQRVLLDQPAYANLGLITLDGHLTCHGQAQVPGQGVFLGDRHYFTQALQTGQLTMGGYQVGRVQGRKSIALARPAVGGEGKIKGVVYAALDLASLQSSLRGARTVPGARVLLLDQAGTVLAASDARLDPVGVPLADAPLREAMQAHRAGPLEAAPDSAGPALLRTLRPVRLQEQDMLFVAVTVPTATVLAPALHNLHLRLAGVLALGLAVALGLWGLGQRLLVTPLESLIKGIGEIRSGDYGQALRQPATSLREMSALQHALGSLVMGLESQRYERDQALSALREREIRYRELFKVNPQVMFLYDIRTLRFLAVNDAAVNFYGYTAEEFAGMRLQDIRPETANTALLDHLASHQPVIASPALPRIWTHRRKNGELRQMEALFHTTTFDGRTAHLTMLTDISARLAAEAREHAAHEKLEQRVAERTRELELSNRELEAFSYSVSHDLRNPLGAVAMFGQMLSAHLGEAADAQAQLYLARIEQGVRGMERLIDDLLALSKVTRAELVLVPVDLSALCRTVLQGLREREPARQVTVTVEEGLYCIGDAGLLRQMLANLIGNAWKFTGHTDDARIRIGRQRSTVPDCPRVFFVEDNGTGFDMKFAGRLFRPFERLHGDHDFQGTGVGLATVQRIVARHGGRIWPVATIGRGATFFFTLNPAQTPE